MHFMHNNKKHFTRYKLQNHMLLIIKVPERVLAVIQAEDTALKVAL